MPFGKVDLLHSSRQAIRSRDLDCHIVFTLGRKEYLSEWFSRARQFSIRIGFGIAFNLALAGSLQAACPRARC
jgi:hypothetical protein